MLTEAGAPSAAFSNLAFSSVPSARSRKSHPVSDISLPTSDDPISCNHKPLIFCCSPLSSSFQKIADKFQKNFILTVAGEIFHEVLAREGAANESLVE